MTALNSWLDQATRRIPKESAAQVRREIHEHYASELEAAIARGATDKEADQLAVAALGDAGIANCQYRDVLLTPVEARLLREGNWEAQALCSRVWLKRLLLAVPVALLIVGSAFFLRGADTIARTLFVGGITMGLLFAPLFLPIYTPVRGRAYRIAKWAVLIVALAVLLGSETFKYSWLFFSCLWPMAWIEWTRYSIRRKLPVAKWPRQLYL
jgi:hypothetical protein